MEAVGLDLGTSVNYLQDLTVSTDGSNLLDIIDQNVPGYHRVTKTEPFQDPMEDEPVCIHRNQLRTTGCGSGTCVTSTLCETSSLDLMPNITEDFQKMYSDWQQHLGSLQASDGEFFTELMFNLAEMEDTEASDEEDLVVDEVVSFSMTGGNRHRSESFSSITGPCVPPDLLMDTGKACGELGVRLREVKEEEEEDLENNILLENALVPSEDADTPPTLRAEHEQCMKMKLNLKSEEVEIGPEEEWIEDFEVSNPDKELGTITSQVIDETLQINEIQYADGKDVKLPAGSIVLAMVNESGSLVPLPQLQVDPQTLSRAVKMDAHENLIDEEVDIETVTEKTPVLEAGDLDSLLAQFEASEAVNKSGDNSESLNKRKDIWRPKSVGTVASMPSGQRPSGSGHVLSQVSPTHQNIKDALPKEIIEKIKASTKRKSTQMLSEPLVVRKGRGVKQQDTSHPRTKALRSVSQTIPQNAPDLRVPPPLDHDYCFSPEKQKKNKQNENYSNTSEVLFNKLPEYYTTIPRRDTKPSLSSEDSHDDGGKKDSGVESGDVSDASVETEERRKEGKDSRNSQGKWNDRQNEDINGYKNEVYNKLPAYMTDIGNSKPKDDIEEDINSIREEKGDDNSNKEKERSENSDKEKEEKMIDIKPEVKLIKRKLNLLEYRQRIRSAQSSCCPSPTPTDTIQDTSSSIPLPVSDLAGKMETIKTDNVEHKQMEECENYSNGHAITEEDTEEGELKGDSDQETSVKSDPGNISTECVKGFPYGVAKSSSSIEIKTLEKSLSVITSFYNSSASVNYGRRWKSSSHTSSSRRWSSSSRSRSRSRSPTHSKKHTSRNRRSSRGKRKRTHRHSQSSQSPHSSSRRRWSRSRSHSRSRSRSSSSNGNSSCSSSRSRSRSSPFKSRNRWSYSRRFSSRERRRYHSRSRSRSSSRYSRVSRSRSPIWRSSRRSRSPHYRLPIRPRRPEDEDRSRQVEERRVVYIGRLSEGTSKGDLRRRFQKFGEIVDISVHFRDHGDNYGFVTYKNRDEAYNAVEHGNEDPSLPRYDLCFGGRRAFCRVQYSDLDAQATDGHYFEGSVGAPFARNSGTSLDFDSLLRAAMDRKKR